MTERLMPDHEGDAHFDRRLYAKPEPNHEKPPKNPKNSEGGFEDFQEVKKKLTDPTEEAKRKNEEKKFRQVYDLLTPEERDQLVKIKDASERRAFIQRKYSKLYRSP